MEKVENIYQSLMHSLPVLERISLSLSRQEYFEAMAVLRREMVHLEGIFTGVLGQQEYFAELAGHEQQEYVVFLLQSLIEAMEHREYVLLNDVLSQLVIPWCYEVQEYIVVREKSEVACVERDGVTYQVEYTAAGFPTVKIIGEQEFYIHSNRNAMTEAAHLADSWYKEAAEEYILFGMGLGYAVQALLEKSEYFTVKVYESDAGMLELARSVGCYEELLASGRVEMVLDTAGTGFAAAVQKQPDAEVLFFYPSIRLIRQRELRERFEDAFIRQASEKGQYAQLNGNFKRNIASDATSIEELRAEFAGKRVYLVAAGPSLDKNVEYLKQAAATGIIVAAGTVLKKLLRIGVPVNYVVVTDAKAPTYRQVEGIEDAGIPLLGLSTAYYRFFTDYQAKHYLLCQEGFAPAEELAREHGWPLIQTGGSVITAALSAALTLGAAELVFVGLDLAFTGGKDHASDTASIAENISGDQRMVRDIYGELVPTGRNLDMYRKFIEQQIKMHPEVRFTDATEGGARITGAGLAKLSDVID